jgi:broad-specificity NMP kinase
MKTLLTGIAGTGKSTIVEALNERGIPAIDLHEIPDLFFWQDKTTKKKIEYTPVHSREWFNTVDRICDIDRLKEMLSHYDDIVMAGTTSGSDQKDFFPLFDKIILLQADPHTIVNRMQTRTNKSGYGKTKAEQEDNIKWQKEYDSLLISLRAIPVSTEGRLEDVVNKIVEIISRF